MGTGQHQEVNSISLHGKFLWLQSFSLLFFKGGGGGSGGRAGAEGGTPLYKLYVPKGMHYAEYPPPPPPPLGTGLGEGIARLPVLGTYFFPDFLREVEGGNSQSGPTFRYNVCL